jgi:hypothetical protein
MLGTDHSCEVLSCSPKQFDMRKQDKIFLLLALLANFAQIGLVLTTPVREASTEVIMNSHEY